MRKTLVILTLVCLMFPIVNGDTNNNEDNSTKHGENNHESTMEITTTIKLPLFIRIFGKKPLRFIKKSISKILGKNLTSLKNRSHSMLKDEKIRKKEKSTAISTNKNTSYATIGGRYDEMNGTEGQTYRSGSWSKKYYTKDMSYYRRFVYTSVRYVSPVKVRKYYTPVGSPYTQEPTNQRTTKIDASRTTLKINPSKDIRIFTTTIPEIDDSKYEVNKFNDQSIVSQSEHNSHGGKRQRRCSVHESSELEQGYTYLLRKKRPQSTFNPYAYLTKLSKKPVFTGDYTPRRYTYFRSTTGAATTTTSMKPALTTRPKTFIRIVPRVMVTTESKTTSATPKPVFRTTLKPWSRRYYTPMSQTSTMVAKRQTRSAGNQPSPSTRAMHYWFNNWNAPYMSYYMYPVNHTFRTYEPSITTGNPNPQSKTTRAMYYLSQYWNKGYFSYYTNFDPPDESMHAFAKRLGYFPDATTRFKKIRMMPKRYRPEGFIDLFSVDSFVRDINQRLSKNQTYPPPHERDSISASIEDVSYWFFFNNSVTIDQLNPGMLWKNKPRPTMKPMPSYFFKDSIITRYYPPSREEDLEKVSTSGRKFQRPHSTDKPSTRRSFISHIITSPSPAVHTSVSRSSVKFLHARTPIPTLPTNKETTAANIDPYGLLNKIIQYNAQMKRSFRDGANIHQSTLHPVNELPRIFQLPFTLNSKMMMYTDYRGKQLFTLLGKFHIHEDNKTLECVRNPSEFLNPLKVVAPPPQSGYYRIIQRHRIRDNDMIERKPAHRNFDINNPQGQQKLLPNDRTVAVEIRFYPLRTPAIPATIKTWNEYLESQKNQSSSAGLPVHNGRK